MTYPRGGGRVQSVAREHAGPPVAAAGLTSPAAGAMVRAPMPILRGSVTFARFRSEAGKLPRDTRRWLARGLARGAFQPIDLERGEDDRAAGFVALENPDATDFSGGVLERGRALFAWRVDTVRVKAAEVRAELERWGAAFQDEHGRAPTRGERSGARDHIRHGLRAKQAPTTRLFDVSWSLETGELQIWASSRKVIDEASAGIEQAFEVKLAPCSVSAQAVRAGIPERALQPTPELFGLAKEEVLRGEA
jgi:recombination associated protein RdgC